MKKFAIILLSILIAGLFVACNQDVTVDAQTYANMEVGTFVLNGQNYATLQAAVDAIGSKAAGDNVIYLTRHASGPGAKIANKDVTIDFQRYTYSFTNVNGLQGQDVTGKDFGLSITTGSDVVLKGLQKIDLNDKTTTDLTMVYVEGATTSLTIEDAPKMEVSDSQYVFWAANGATLTIGSNSETAPTTITGKIAATGGTEQTSKPVVTFNNNTKIEASELKADSAVVVINTSEDSSIGSFVGANEANIVVSGTGDVTVTENNSESAATYTIENTSSTTPGESATVIVPKTDGTSRTIEPGKEVINDNVPQEDTNPSVAMIGSTLYKTLEAAVTASKSEDTIILLKDIVLGNDAFFDIKGTTEAFNLYIDGSNHVITATSSSKKQYLFMFSDANTSHEASAVCDWGIKNITIRTTGYQTAILTNGEAFDNMSLEKVTIVSNGECLYANGPTNITAKRSSFTLDGSSGYWKDEQDSVYYSAVMVGYGGTVVLEDCEIRSTRHGLATFPSGCNIIAKGNTSVTAANEENSYALWARCDNGYSYWCAGDSTIDVESTGTISGRINVTEPTGDPSASNHRASINIKSGSFINVAFAISDPTGKYSTETNKAIKITGGTFDVDPSGYVAEGYEVVKDGDFWIVKKSDPVAVNINTGTEYFSLQKAFDEAGDGHTIKILKNISISSTTSSGYVLTIDKSITVDGDNKALTIDRSGNPRVANGLLIESENTSSSDDVNVTMQNLTLTFKGCKYGLIAEVDGTGTENVILKDMIITSDEGAPVVVGDSVVLSGNTTIKNQKILNVPGNFIASDTIGGEGSAGGGTWYYAGAVVWGGGNLTVEDGVYISGPVAIEIMNSGGTVTVKDGAEVVCIADDTNGFTETNYMFGNALYCDAGGNMLVQGGTITGGLTTNGTGSISITGGTFDHNPSAYVAPGYYACLGSDLKYHVHGNDNSTHVIQHLEGNKHKVVCSVYGDQAEHDCDTSGTYDECSVCGYHATQVAVVVKANSDLVYFDSWNSFVSQATTLGAASDYTLVMLQDVNSTEQKQVVFGYYNGWTASGYGKTYVFDLYGKNVSLTGYNNAEGTIQIAGNHTLTIKDSSSSHTGILTLTSESDNGGIFLNSQVTGYSSMDPTLNIESGTIVSNCNSRGAICMMASKSSVNINGGEIVSDNYGIWSTSSSYKVNSTEGIIRAAGGVFKAIEGTTAGTRTGGQFFENGVDVTSEYLTN